MTTTPTPEPDRQEKVAILSEYYDAGPAKPRPWSPSWAVVADHPCVTVRCSGCGQVVDDDDIGGRLHYDSVEDALKGACDYGFVQDGDRLLCKPCAGEVVCPRDGHRWEHHHCGPFTAYDGRIVPAYDYWDCEVCGESIDVDPGVAPAPSPDHPTLPLEAGEPA